MSRFNKCGYVCSVGDVILNVMHVVCVALY